MSGLRWSETEELYQKQLTKRIRLSRRAGHRHQRRTTNALLLGNGPQKGASIGMSFASGRYRVASSIILFVLTNNRERQSQVLYRETTPRCMALLASTDCAVPSQLFIGTHTEIPRFAARGFWSTFQREPGVPQSRCLLIAEHPITNHANSSSVHVDGNGHFLITATD